MQEGTAPECMVHTRNGATGTASSEMVDNGGITLDDAIDVQITPETSIRNLLILETSDGRFDSLRSGCSGLEETHPNTSSTDHPD